MAGEILDIFHADPFTAIALTDAVQRNPFQPVGLGALGVFDPNPIRVKALAVEERTGRLALIPFSERGAEGTQRTTEKRAMRYFEVPRLMHDGTVYADEVQGIREFGTESILMQIETEVARRLSGPTGLLASVEYTKEYLRLAALQGLVLNPKDGSILYNWFDEFQMPQAVETPFDLVAQSPNTLRPICTLYVGGRRYQLPVLPTQTPEQIATALAALVNADAFALVGASTMAAAVMLTAVNAGLIGNEIDLRQNYLGAPGGESTPDGLTLTIARMVGGTINPTTALQAAATPHSTSSCARTPIRPVSMRCIRS
ncbi:major capsid protein [Paraburkholderia sediminicola]|uniref:major capsid protein n=1 Tax=Paraburkholderia sediminicola TaxID=458836 RepID=UPI0038BB52C8